MLLPRYASGEAARLSIVREEIETPTGRQGVAQPGRALASDARGRRIEACHPDQIASVAQRESHRLISDGSRVRLLPDAPNRYHRSMIGMRRCEEAKRRRNPESAARALHCFAALAMTSVASVSVKLRFQYQVLVAQPDRALASEARDRCSSHRENSGVFADGSAARLENACTATCGDRHLSAPPFLGGLTGRGPAPAGNRAARLKRVGIVRSVFRQMGGHRLRRSVALSPLH